MRSKIKSKLAAKKCGGSNTKPWSKCEGRAAGALEGRKHSLLKSGTVLWCAVCGSFAESKASRLGKQCKGPPPKQLGSGGVRSQLNRLRASLHPVTLERLPQAVLADGGSLIGAGTYSRLKTSPTQSGFAPYQPEVFPLLQAPARLGKSAVTKIKLRLARIKLESKIRRKMRVEEEAADAIATFVNEPSDDEESRQFWHGLTDTVVDRDIFKHTASIPNPYGRTKQLHTRAARLTLN